MINKYGLKMNNLRAASGNTINWTPRSGGYTQISYDRATGDILTSDHVSLGYRRGEVMSGAPIWDFVHGRGISRGGAWGCRPVGPLRR